MSEARPRSMTAPEIARKIFRFPNQSTLISLNSSIIQTVSFRHHSDFFVPLNADRLRPLMAVKHPFEQRSRYEHRRKHIRNEPDKERHGKSFDRPGSEQEKEHGRD